MCATMLYNLASTRYNINTLCLTREAHMTRLIAFLILTISLPTAVSMLSALKTDVANVKLNTSYRSAQIACASNMNCTDASLLGGPVR